MTCGQKALILVLASLIIVGIPFLVLSLTLGTDDEFDDGFSSGEPSLTEYWDRAACYDLFGRVEAMRAMGATNQEMEDSFYRAEGAVKRYGPYEVFTHCRSKYKADWDTGR